MAKTTRGRTWLAAVALLVLVFALFGEVRRHSFLHFDDADYVTENAVVSKGLTTEGVRWAFTGFHAGNWHPLTWLSHMLDVELFGMRAGAHKLVNVGLHGATSLLLLLGLARITGRFWASSLVAALFAVHPLHVESVAWVAERKDVLSTFWWALTIGAYIGFVRHRTASRMTLVLVLYTLALLSKPMVVTLPLLLLVLDYWPLGRFAGAEAPASAHLGANAGRGFGTGALVREKLPLAAMAIAASVATLLAQQAGGAIQSADAFPWLARIANVPVAYATYVVKTFWPSPLAALYPYPESIPAWQALGAAVLIAAFSWLAFRQRTVRPYLLAGWIWFLTSLLPVIGLIQVGSQPYANRYLYVPIIGLLVMAAWWVDDLVQAVSRRPARVAVVALVLTAVISLSLVTRTHVGVWQDDLTLWNHAVRVTEGNYRAHTNLGFAYQENGQVDLAVSSYREAIRLRPDYANARNYLGSALTERGEFAQAADELRAALRARPRFFEAHNNLGLALSGLGQTGDAIGAFREAVRLNPRFGPGWNNLGIALAGAGQIDAAIQAFQESVKYQPESAEAHLNLATALESGGRTDEARRVRDLASRKAEVRSQK